MCRLLYLPPEFPRDPKILISWFSDLDKSFGGDGCGIATMRSGIKKGVALSPADSAVLASRCTSHLVWHTRRISCGLKVDELCHPFKTGRGFLVHNGHWHQGAFSAKLLAGEWSDTKIAAHYISLYGWKAFTKEVVSGVWIHLTKGGVQVCYESGDLHVEMNTGALASEPCKDWGRWEKAKKGTYDVDERVKKDETDYQNYTYVWNAKREDRSLYDAIRHSWHVK